MSNSGIGWVREEWGEIAWRGCLSRATSQADFETVSNLSLLSSDALINYVLILAGSPHIPLSAFECSGFKGLSEEPSVFLTSRSFARTG